MRLTPSGPLLFSLSCLYCFSASMPLSPPKLASIEPLVQRAKYSVVAVDGGAAATGGSNGSPEVAAPTILSTIVQTKTPAPTTVVETEKVTLPLATKTDQVTVTATGYSIINIQSAANTAEPTAPAPSSSSSSSSTLNSKVASTPATTPSSPSTEQLSTKSSPTQSSSKATSVTSSATLSASTSVAAAPTSMKAPYDNGQWHTSYPAWPNPTGATKVPTSTIPTFPTTTAGFGAVGQNKTINSRRSNPAYRRFADV